MTALVIALRTRTGLNLREHPMARHRRVLNERAVTRAHFLTLPYAERERLKASPLFVTLTRIGPRAVDDDGAVGGLKSVRDELARCLGRDDADPTLRFRYGPPERGAYGVRVEFAPLTAVCQACGRPL